MGKHHDSPHHGYKTSESATDDVGAAAARSQAKAKEFKGAGGNFGGPWKAFVSEQSKGQKFNRRSIKDLRAEYVALTPEEYQHYKALGDQMVLAGIYKSAIQNRPDTSGNSGNAATLAQWSSTSTSDVLANPECGLLMDGNNFHERYQHYRELVKYESKQALERKRSSRSDDVSTDIQDASFRDTLLRYGGESLLDGLRQIPHCELLQSFDWKLPIIPFLKARLRFKVSQPNKQAASS